MLTYTIEHVDNRSSAIHKTLHVEGFADFNQESKLNEILLDALSNCDHLIVNIKRLYGSDPPALFDLINNTQRIAQLWNKNMTIID